MIHQHGVGAVALGQAQVVHHGQHGAAGLAQPLGDQGEDVLLVHQIQVVGGFVQDQQAGVLGKDLRQKDALQFAAGEGQHAGVAQLCEAGERQGLLHLRLAVLVLPGEDAGGVGIAAKGDHFRHGVGIAHGVPLGQYAQLLCQLCRTDAADVPAAQRHASGVGHTLGNGLDEGGLASAVGAHQHEPLAFLQGEGEIVHHGMLAIADGDVFSFQHSGHLAFRVR